MIAGASPPADRLFRGLLGPSPWEHLSVGVGTSSDGWSVKALKANRRYDFWIRVPCSSCPGPRSASGPQLDSLDQPFASNSCRCEARSDANAVHSAWRNGQRDRRARGGTTSVIAVRCHAGIRDEPGEIEGEPRASPAADARTKRTSTPTTRAQADLVLKQGNSKVSPP